MALSLLLAATAAAQIPAPCLLRSNSQFSLGPTNYTDRLKPAGQLNALLLFVDFSDAPATETTYALYDRLVPPAERWYISDSGGKVNLTILPVHKWYRMPHTAASYNFARGLTFQAHKTYITDALTAADAEIDYSRYDLYYILASNTQLISYSPTWVPQPGQGVTFDGKEIRHVVTLGADVRVNLSNYGSWVIIHETGHLFGLLDLYDFNTSTFPDYHRFVGGWDPMGWLQFGSSFTAWDQWKLLWLDDTAVNCVGQGDVQETVRPLTSNAGVRALTVPLSATRALVAEVRNQTGLDSNLCDSGALVYTVDSSIATGQGPMRVINGGDTGTSGACGPLAHATFGNPGKPTSYTDPASGVAFTFAVRGDGGYDIGVHNPVAVAGGPDLVSPVRVALTGTAAGTLTVSAPAATPFAVQPDSSWIQVTPSQATTPATLTISADPNLAPGTYQGIVTLRTANQTRRVAIDAVIPASAGAPVLQSTGVLNAASYAGGAVSPGELVALFGSKIGPDTLAGAALTGEGLMPTTVAGTRILFDGRPAPLIYVSASQSSAVVPYEVAGQTATQIVVERDGIRSAPVTMPVTGIVPGIFTLSSTGKGFPAGLNQDNSFIGPDNPSPAGSTIVLYGTGEGITSPPSVDGMPAQDPYPAPLATFTVEIGGKQARIAYLGAAPTLVAGVFQLNVEIPADLKPAMYPLIIKSGQTQSAPALTINVGPHL